MIPWLPQHCGVLSQSHYAHMRDAAHGLMCALRGRDESFRLRMS